MKHQISGLSGFSGMNNTVSLGSGISALDVDLGDLDYGEDEVAGDSSIMHFGDDLLSCMGDVRSGRSARSDLQLGPSAPVVGLSSSSSSARGADLTEEDWSVDVGASNLGNFAAADEDDSFQAALDKMVACGSACAVALAHPATSEEEAGWIWSVAPIDNEEGWSLFWKDNHEEDITQEDMSKKRVVIEEHEGLLEAVAGRSVPTGLWFGGERFSITSSTVDDMFGTDTRIVLAVKARMGVCIVSPEDYMIILGMYDEERGQSAGGCMKACMVMAAALVSGEYEVEEEDAASGGKLPTLGENEVFV